MRYFSILSPVSCDRAAACNVPGWGPGGAQCGRAGGNASVGPCAGLKCMAGHGPGLGHCHPQAGAERTASCTLP